MFLYGTGWIGRNPKYIAVYIPHIKSVYARSRNQGLKGPSEALVKLDEVVGNPSQPSYLVL